jgi:hypothetical protein
MAKTTQELIEDIDVQLELLIASPEVDIKDGDVTIKCSQKMAQLIAARKALLEQSGTDADLVWIAFDGNYNEFGIPVY